MDETDALEIDHLDLYRLDYEDHPGPIAAGGELLKEGDHIYMFCGVANVTLYQHHGIVLDVKESRDYLLIAEFTNAELPDTAWFQSTSHASVAVTDGVRGGFRFVREDDPSKWHKVKYQANPLECLTWSPGTCSSATPDHVDLVLTRVQFLHEQYYKLPSYNTLISNCESVAVWCKTGKFTSLQGSRALDVTKVVVPTAGAVVFPVVGIALGGLALWHSMSASRKSGDFSDRLNREFCWYAMGRSPVTREWVVNPSPDGGILSPKAVD